MIVFSSGWGLPRTKIAIARLALVTAVHVTALSFVALMLLVTAPGFLGYHSISVMSGSMGDALPVGSVAVTRPILAADVREGDVVAFTQSEAGVAILHRVIAIEDIDGQRVATMKGDANDSPDAAPLVLAGKGEVVAYHVPLAGYAIGFTQTWLVRLLLLALFGAWLVAPLARRLIKDEHRVRAARA